jgi:hypothetical protein
MTTPATSSNGDGQAAFLTVVERFRFGVAQIGGEEVSGQTVWQ